MRTGAEVLKIERSDEGVRVETSAGSFEFDYLVISAHKLRAPRGAAALIHRGRAPEPRPLILGGSQERGRRAGTEDVPAIAALGAAFGMATAIWLAMAPRAASVARPLLVFQWATASTSPS